MWWKRKHNLPHHFQLAQGPYVPGCCDVFAESTKPETKDCFFRIYYPAKLSDDKDYSSRWVPWIPHSLYLTGMSQCVQMWTWIVKLVFNVFAGNIHIPVVWCASPRAEGPPMPVVINSHGLGGTRFIYSGTCIELASAGCVVVAVEHRDKSACITPKTLSSTEHPHMADVKEWITFTPMPENGATHADLRYTQVQQRTSECLSTLDILEQINNGTFRSNIQLPSCIDKFKGRLDMNQIVMMGHSFGAATALLALGKDKRFKAGVILDAWMYPLKEFKATLPEKITQPLVFINTETFHIDKNVNALQKYTKDHSVYTIRSTTHEHQTDTVHVFGSWLNVRMTKLHPSTASQINNHLIMRFLGEHIGLEGGDERFLMEEADKITSGFIIAEHTHVSQ